MWSPWFRRIGLDVVVDEAYPYVMLFTGEIPFIAPSRARARADDLCSERISQRKRPSSTLEPGESHTAAWGLSPTNEVKQ